jgi:hypothetical protein
MVRLILMMPLLVLGGGQAIAQINQKPIPSRPIFEIGKIEPSHPVTAERTIQVLRAAGILNVRPDSPFTLSARHPYLDPQTFMSSMSVNLDTERNLIGMAPNSWIRIQWFGNPERRYVVDCAVPSGQELEFIWGRWTTVGVRTQMNVPVNDGRAAIVLPAGFDSQVTLHSSAIIEVSSCDVTPFAS